MVSSLTSQVFEFSHLANELFNTFKSNSLLRNSTRSLFSMSFLHFMVLKVEDTAYSEKN